MKRFLVAMLVASCGATPAQPRFYRVVRAAVTPPTGMTVDAAFELPAQLDVDAYGARKLGRHLALGVGRRGGAPSAIAVIDTATAQLALLPSVNRGWTSTAVAGAGDWLIAREKHQSCADCWDWALYAYHLPSRVPLLLGRSTKPTTQLLERRPRVPCLQGREGDDRQRGRGRLVGAQSGSRRRSRTTVAQPARIGSV